MALTNKPAPARPGRQLLHFFIRLVGLTGLMLAVVGLVLADTLENPFVGRVTAVVGFGALAFALLCELQGVYSTVTSRRGAMGLSVVVQVLLAAALVAGVNVFSFYHYQRLDWTQGNVFTLDEAVRGQLAQLRSDTDIVVYQQYVSFGQRADNRQDKYDLAAQKKIVEKVKDLAELFQDLGPRFRVQVLDIQDDDFESKLEAIRTDKPELAGAIEKAPENSVFFYSGDTKRVQRLSFSDVYQLDKKASEEGQNLVLIDQGVDRFARKIFNLEERKPRVGFAVVHELLGHEGDREYGMPALKKVLAARGFEGRDIILKAKWPRPEPTVLEHEENRFEILEAQRKGLERLVKNRDEILESLGKLRKEWETTPLAELRKNYVYQETPLGVSPPVPRERLEQFKKERGFLPPHKEVTDDYRLRIVARVQEESKELEDEVGHLRDRLKTATEEQGKLRVENLAEQKRLTDLHAKFNRLLADTDLLVLPRPTMFDIVTRGESNRIPAPLHHLDKAQVDAIRDFIKAGKPVMFCLGPTTEPEAPLRPPTAGDADLVEQMLQDFGIELNKQAILFDVEAEAMTDKTGRALMLGASVEVPPARFEWSGGERSARWFASEQPALSHEIRTSLALTARSFGKQPPADLRVRHPRPVYRVTAKLPKEAPPSALALVATPWSLGPYGASGLLAWQGTKRIDDRAVFLLSDPASWNEENPFGTDEEPPQYKRPKDDDPKKGTLLEERRGPFPIAVALEAEVPSWWYKPGEKPQSVRLAVLGNGNVFIGDQATPMKEKLFLDVANWLLGRDDLLAREAAPWEYPRVEMSATTSALWQWGTRLGLPLLFVYLGVVVGLVRRMR